MAVIKKHIGKSDSTKPTPVTDSSVGRLVQYEDDSQLVLAIVIGTKKDKLVVLNVRGRELELGRGRLYFLPQKDPFPHAGAAERVATLTALDKKIAEQVSKIEITELWSVVASEPRTYSAGELCEIYYNSDTTEQHAALRIALIGERIHFKRDKDGFEPRPAQVVEELSKAEEVRRRKEIARQATIQFLEQRLGNPKMPFPEDALDDLALLAEIAAGVVYTNAARQKEAKDLLLLCSERLHIPANLALEKKAFEILIRIGYFTETTNLSFIRHDIPVRHLAAAVEEAKQTPLRDVLKDYEAYDQQERVDLTHIDAITIDDESTQDMDDALSVQQLIDGFELGIHITDVAWLVKPGSPLDESARRRVTSIYCADQTVHMLPPELSNDRLSLKQDVVRPCLSCQIRFDTNYNIRDWSLKPSFIKSKRRYTYQEVDDILDADTDVTLRLLHEIAAALEAQRIERGAVKVHKREVVPYTLPDGRVELLEIDEDSPARSLVAEMMVCANYLIARFAVEHKLPMLFRGQERFDEEEPARDSEIPEGPARDFAARLKLKKSTVELDPVPHSGLGLPCYLQATSPIRRYMDLVHQRQIISYLQNRMCWIERADLEQLAQEVEIHLQAANLASRETRRFWLMRYLAQRKRGVPINATVVRLDLKSPLVELDEVYITVMVKLPSGCKLGDRVALKIVNVDPQGDYLKVEASF